MPKRDEPEQNQQRISWNRIRRGYDGVRSEAQLTVLSHLGLGPGSLVTCLRKVTSPALIHGYAESGNEGDFWLKPQGGYFPGSILRPSSATEYRRFGLVSSPLTWKPATLAMQGTHQKGAARRIERQGEGMKPVIGPQFPTQSGGNYASRNGRMRVIRPESKLRPNRQT